MTQQIQNNTNSCLTRKHSPKGVLRHAVRILKDQARVDVRDQLGLKKQYEWVFVPEAHLGPPEIFEDELKITEPLGEDLGSFAKVHKGYCRSEHVAVKILLKDRIRDNQREKFRDEITIISSTFHPNLCLFLGASSGNKLMIISELMKMNLTTFCNDQGLKLSLSKRIKMAKDCALGINWLHQTNPPIIHGNITPNNLLVDENLRVKVSDFGMNKIKQIFGVNLLSDTQKNLENLKWVAPEILEGSLCTEKSDVYSFGMILWMLVTLQKPYLDIHHFDKLKEILVIKKTKPALPPTIHPQLRDLLSSCWDIPSRRPTLASVIPILDSLIIATAIPDANAASFWKNNFSDQTHVEWPIFMNALATEIKLFPKHSLPIYSQTKPEISLTNPTEIQQIKILHALLVTKQVTAREREVVRLETFGWVVSWFGTLQTNFLKMIQTAVHSPWFHGIISASEATALLQFCAPGTYLIRLSTSYFGAWTLSYISPTYQISHYRFSYNLQKGVFIFAETEYPSISDILEHHTKPMRLSMPLLGSKYTIIFTEMETTYIGQHK